MMMMMMMMMIGTTRAHRLMSQRSREVSTGSTVEDLGSSVCSVRLRRFNMFQYVLRCFKMFQVIARFSHECPRAHPEHASSPLPCGVRVQSETKDITIECKQLIQDRALPEKEIRQILCLALVAPQTMEIRSPNLVIDDD